MSDPPANASDVLVYQAKPAAQSESGTIFALLPGGLASLFSAIVVVATVVERDGIRSWRGVQVAGLWACLLLALALTPTGLLLGGRLILRRSIRRHIAWAAVGLSGASAALLVYFMILIGGLF